MEFSVSHPRFQERKLSVRAGSGIKGPSLLLDGVEQKKTRAIKKLYLLEDDNGEQVTAELKSFVDPIPAIIIAGETVRLAPAMTWYEYLLILLPWSLVLFGGALGGGIGACGAMFSARIIRGPRSTAVRYGMTLMVTLACYVVYFVIAGMVWFILEMNNLRN